MENIVKDFDSFKNVFSSNFYKKVVKKTLVPVNMTKSDFKKIIEKLYQDIKTGNYSPSILRSRLFTYKVNNVA